MTFIVVRSVLPGTMGRDNVRSVVGHSWIEIHNSNGTVESLGYYPEVSSPYASGEVKNIDATKFAGEGFSSQPITITEAQAQAFRDFATITNQFGTYALLGNDGSNPFGIYNCASWIVSGLKTAQVSGQFPTALIVPWFAPIQFDPFTPLAPLERGFAIVSPVVSTAYTLALNWVEPRRDPLVLDLDGGGITTSGINPAAPILFDQDGDGTLTATGWIASGEAIVVRDLNGNGRIDSGRELFGDNTVLTRGPNVGKLATNGFTALADLDANAAGVADGKFDASDAAFASVKLWKDLNQNGVSEAGELFSFADLGVQHINLAATASNVNLGGGNTQTFTGSFTRVGGATGSAGTAELAGSLLLANNNFYREFTDDPATTAAALALPQMRGSGQVRDLQPAMSLGTTQATALQAAVAQFAGGTTRDAQRADIDAVLQSWGATSSMLTSIQTNRAQADPAAPVGAITAIEQFAQANPGTYAQITALERFNGTTILDKWVRLFGGTVWVADPPHWQSYSYNAVSYSAQQATFIQQAYEALKEGVYGALVVQTRLKPYLDSIGLVVDQAGLRCKNSLKTRRGCDLRRKYACSPHGMSARSYQNNSYTGVGISGLFEPSKNGFASGAPQR